MSVSDEVSTAVSHLVLIVDDHLDCAAPLKALFRSGGFRAEAVASAGAALDFLASGERPNLIVLDNMMPQISGIELLRLLRCDPETADIPVMMYSASDAPEDVERCRRLGASDFVCKGRIDYSDLLFRARCLIGGRVPVADIWNRATSGTDAA